MNERDFAYWLQGFFELTDTDNLTKEQVAVIKQHLNLVFKKETTCTLTLLNSSVVPTGFVPYDTGEAMLERINNGFYDSWIAQNKIQISC